MSYEAALSAAGAEVLAYKEFGSYQGDWWAKIKYQNQESFVTGSFGSCTVCDAFRAEFYYHDDEDTSPDYTERLARFAQDYLENLKTFEQAIEQASVNIEWDSEADEMVAWLTSHRPDTKVVCLVLMKDGMSIQTGRVLIAQHDIKIISEFSELNILITEMTPSTAILMRSYEEIDHIHEGTGA